MGDPLCRTCKLPIPKPRYGLRKSREYHLRCRPKPVREKRSPVSGRQTANDYGPGWRETAMRCRTRDKRACVKCTYKRPKGSDRGLPVDHIVPFRLLKALGYTLRQANHRANLWTLCAVCHGQKKCADDAIKSADTMEYLREMQTFCGSNRELIERFAAAAKHYGISIYWLE